MTLSPVTLARITHTITLVVGALALAAFYAPQDIPEWGESGTGAGIFLGIAATQMACYLVLSLEIIKPTDRKELLRWRTGMVGLGALGFLLCLLDPCGVLASWTDLPGPTSLVAAWGQVIIVIGLVGGLSRIYRWVSDRWENPAVLFAGSFAALIALGTLLLLFPRARRDPDVPVPFSHALFTSTSAVCVTGLTVEDTAEYWSRSGQWIILSLFQLGGLGIATLGAYIVRVVGQRPTLRETVLQGRLLDHEVPGEVHRLLRTIVLVTLFSEVLGALLLSGLWAGESRADRIFYSVFHSISAFCNAGFSVRPGGLEGWGNHWQIRWVIPALIIIGGLGFSVLDNLGRSLLAGCYWGWSRWRGRPVPYLGWGRWHLTTRLVVFTSVFLLIAGTLGIFTFERSNQRFPRAQGVTHVVTQGLAAQTSAPGGPPLGSMVQLALASRVSFRRSYAEDLDIAWFHAVSCRTAGFNTVPLNAVTDATKFMMVVLMFIGASPGSTGGGVKTVPIAVLGLVLWAGWRRREDVELAHRRIPLQLIRQALLILSLAAGILVTLTLAVTAIEGGRFVFIDCLFEVTSALGTAGLSTGITGELHEPSRIILILTMFMGRIGPFTLVLAVARREERLDYEYPQEGIVLG